VGLLAFFSAVSFLGMIVESAEIGLLQALPLIYDEISMVTITNVLLF
jgi:hypothetical protein